MRSSRSQRPYPAENEARLTRSWSKIGISLNWTSGKTKNRLFHLSRTRRTTKNKRFVLGQPRWQQHLVANCVNCRHNKIGSSNTVCCKRNTPKEKKRRRVRPNMVSAKLSPSISIAGTRLSHGCHSPLSCTSKSIRGAWNSRYSSDFTSKITSLSLPVG